MMHTPEFIQARIDQWEMSKLVAASDIARAEERLEYWRGQLPDDA